MERDGQMGEDCELYIYAYKSYSDIAVLNKEHKTTYGTYTVFFYFSSS
jgi:hypothetical protein